MNTAPHLAGTTTLLWSVSRRWRLILLVFAAVLAGGLGWHFLKATSVPKIPDVELGELDAEIADSIREASSDVQRRPQSADSWGRLGAILFAHGLYGQSATCLAQAESLNSKDPRWPYFQGLILLHNDPNQGIETVKRALERGPNEVGVRLRLAEALLGQGQLDEAETHFRGLLKTHADNSRAALGLGQILLRKNDLRGSLPYFTKAAASPFARRAAEASLAEAFFRLGDRDAAEQAQKRATEAGPDLAWPDPLLREVESLQAGTATTVEHAEEMIKHARTAEAIAVLERWVSTHPEADQALLALGRAYLSVGNARAAVKVLRRFQELKPRAPVAPFMLGGALHMQKDYRGAAACFRETIRLKPDHALAFYNLGQCLRELGEQGNAIRAFEESLRYRPDLAGAHINLAKLLIQEGRLPDARIHFQDAQRLTPDDPEVKALEEKLNMKPK